MKKMSLCFLTVLLAFSAACSSTVNETNMNEKALPKQLPTSYQQLDYQSELTNTLATQSFDSAKPYIEVNPFDISPLSVLIAFDANKDKTYTITLCSNTDSKADLTYTFTNTDKVIGALAGLNVNGDTKIIINDGESDHTFTVTSDPIPNNALTRATITQNSSDLTANHLVFTSPSANGYVSAYDTVGDLRFILDGTFTWDVNVTQNNELIVSNETLIELPYYMSGFYTMDFCGRISNQYIVPGGYHHDIDELANGNFLVASNDLNSDTVEDVIVEIDRNSGEVVKEFNLKDIIDPNTGKSLNWSAKDWFHNNSVEYDPIDNTLILSGRHQDVVVILDYDTKALVGLVGDSTNWDERYLPYFYQPIGDNFEFQYAQHAASYNDKHQLILFDNGMFRSKDKTNTVDAINNYSRFVVYELDQDLKTIRQVSEYGKERGYAYYSPYICDVDQIDENRYLVNSGGISYLNGKINNMPGALTEYDVMETYITLLDDNQCVWEMMLPTNIYRAELIDVNSVSYNGDEFAAHGAMEPIESTGLDFLDTANALSSDELNNLSINLYYDDQRVVLDTSIYRKDTLSLIAVSETNIQQFDIQNEKETGMCVSIFNEEDENNHLIQSIPLSMISEGTHFYYLYNDTLYDSGYTYLPSEK